MRFGTIFSKNSIKSNFGPKNDNFWPKIAKKAKKWQFFGQKMTKRLKDRKKGIFDKQKVRLSVPSGIWLLGISSKWHFFDIFLLILSKNGFFFAFLVSWGPKRGFMVASLFNREATMSPSWFPMRRDGAPWAPQGENKISFGLRPWPCAKGSF